MPICYALGNERIFRLMPFLKRLDFFLGNCMYFDSNTWRFENPNYLNSI